MFGVGISTTTAGKAPTSDFGGLKTIDTATPAQNVGLGGIDMIQTNKTSEFSIRETQVPDEIVKTFEDLITHMDKEKTFSTDLSNSMPNLPHVSSEIIRLECCAENIENEVIASYNHIKSLRYDTSKLMDMTSRIQATPGGQQQQSFSAYQCFGRLVQKYEVELNNYKRQIRLLEQFIKKKNSTNYIKPRHLKLALKKAYDSFLLISARANEIHQKVEEQKKQYLYLRKHILQDATNVFKHLDPARIKIKSHISPGPSPFSYLTAHNHFNRTK